MAVPRVPAGAARPTSEGSKASSRLKAVKKTSKARTKCHNCAPASASNNWETASNTTARRFIGTAPRRSARMINGTMARNPATSTARYSRLWLCSVSPRRSLSRAGTTTKDAVMIRCRLKMPTSKRSNVLLPNTRRKRSETGNASPCKAFGAGTTKATSRAKPPSTEVIQNRPDKPSQPASRGPRISASTKEPPTDMPISAMARVRCFSVTTSPINAMITLAIAPAPCSARPAITP